MNYSLLRYPGGKTKAINQLKEFIPAGTKEICSPFFGGGSFELYLSTKGVKIHAYDNFDLLVNFWQCVLENSNMLSHNVELLFPLSKERFYSLQKKVNNIPNKWMRAATFYALNRSSFSGMGLSGGMSPNHPRFTESSIYRLSEFNYNFMIEKLSFEESIKKHDCLIYADPPYFIKEKLYGNKGDMHKYFDHEKLAKILNERGNFILSYNNCEEIRDMYKEHNFHYPEWKYGLGNDKNSREILITSNY